MQDFEYTVRVYWEDTDAGGIVYHANYLKFFERARTEWLRSLGINQQAIRESDQVLLVVADIYAKYIRSARLDDILTITTRATHIGRASITMEQKAFRQGDSRELLCEGNLKIGCISSLTMLPSRFPLTLATALPNV